MILTTLCGMKVAKELPFICKRRLESSLNKLNNVYIDKTNELTGEYQSQKPICINTTNAKDESLLIRPHQQEKE